MGDIFKRATGNYSIRWYEGGRRRVLATRQASHSEAKRMLIEIEARVVRGEAGIPARRSAALTVEVLCERFLNEYSRPKLKDMARYRQTARSVLKKALPHIGRLATDRVEPADIVKLRDALARQYAPGTVGNVLTSLSAVFGWAVRIDLAPRNPCHRVERPATPSAIEHLSRDEVRRLLAAAQASATTPAGRMLQVGIALAVHTGLRKGELLGLRFTDLDLETRRLTVARSYAATPKSGKVRHLRLPAELVPLIEKWRAECPRSPENVVLPIGQGASKIGGREVMLGLPRLMAQIGLRKVLHPWHLLRHTFASHFVMQGGNILALQKILGHADLKMTMLYAHLAPDFLGGEMDKLRF